MNKYLLLLAAAVFTAGIASAQPHFGDEQGNLNYRGYEMMINPAYAGSHDGLSGVSLNLRKQWMGFDGSPFSQVVQYQTPNLMKNAGVGLSLYNDVAGNEVRTQVNAAYAYKMPMKSGTLSLALQVGVLTLGQDKIEVADPTDPMFATNPPRSWGFNAGFGAYYSTEKYFVGFSVPQLLTNDLDEGTAEAGLKNSVAFDRMQFYLTGGYVFNLSTKFDLLPTALLQASGSTDFGYEVMVNGIYNKRLQVGVGYAAQNSLRAMAGMYITRSIQLAYRYEQSLGNDYKNVSGTHELMLGVIWGKKGTKPQAPLF